MAYYGLFKVQKHISVFLCINKAMLYEIMKYYTNTFAAALYLLLFLVMIYLFVFNFRSLKNYFSAINRKYWVYLLVVFAIGLILRMALYSNADILHADTWNYRIIAQSMMHEYGVLSCNCSLPSNNIGHPYGYSFLLAIAYFFAGISLETSYALNLLFGLFSILVVFLMAYAVLKSEKGALLSAFLLAFLPWHIFYSGSSVSEVANMFFVMLSIALFFITLEKKDKGLYYLTYTLLVFTLLIKKENIMLLISMAVYVLLTEQPDFRKIFKKLKAPKNALFFGALTSFAALEFIGLTVRELRSFPDTILSPASISQNTHFLFQKLFSDPLFLSAILSFVFIFLCFEAMPSNRKKKIYFIILWLILQVIPILLHINGVPNRFLLIIYPSIILVISYVVCMNSNEFKKVFVFLIIASFIFYSSADISKCVIGRDCVFDRERITSEQDRLFLKYYLEQNYSPENTFLVTTNLDHALMLRFFYPNVPASPAVGLICNPPEEQRKIFSNYDVYYFDEKNCPEKWAEYCDAVAELPKTLVVQKEGLDVYKINTSKLLE